MRLSAPAKVNFGLRVVGRRDDGYHELESLFLPLDLADELELEIADAAQTRVSLRLEDGAAVPADSDNLAVRAAVGFLDAAGLARAVSLRLRKRVPVAAGLGGGSSDAGAVLRGLAELLPGALDPGAQRRAALALGADVPFFLDPRPSLVTGVGEHCAPLAPPWPARALLLVNPGQPLSTAAVFGAYDRAPPGERERRGLAEAARAAAGDARALDALLQNDLEDAARGLCPAIGALRASLREAGALAVGLSGSGATLFGVYPDEAAARAALDRFPAPVWARVARTAEAG